jgi:NAD(P)-dependent dehydrogenase (short-subunit alcohol dehydrogenase family)
MTAIAVQVMDVSLPSPNRVENKNTQGGSVLYSNLSQDQIVEAYVNQIDLHHRHAVVTGGGQGIGLAIATRLLQSGASVSLWDRDAEVLKAAVQHLQGNGQVSVEHVDVSNPDSVVAATESTLAKHQKIDILVANAGIAGPNLKTWEYPIDAWRSVVDINLNGIFFCCRAIVPHMMQQNYGRIVNVASIAGKEGNANAPAYSAAKAGVIALTKSLGKETALNNIAVNCITPAAAKTKIFEQLTQAHIDFMLSRIPRGRFVEVDEIAAMVAWLVSEENSFTTAAVFDLSGGRATY